MAAPGAGRLKQSVCRWCYAKTPMEDLASTCVKLGIQAVDLLPRAEWDVARKHGLTLTVVSGPTSIPDGLNRKESHDAIEAKFRVMVEDAAAAKAHSIIVFSGNRKGMGDDEGPKTVSSAEPYQEVRRGKGILVVKELLNSRSITPTICATRRRGA